MAELHDERATLISRAILQMVRRRRKPWSRVFSSKDIDSILSGIGWPKPDFIHEDRRSRVRVAYEFKPPDADVQELQRGLGQVIIYKLYHDYAVLVAPERPPYTKVIEQLLRQLRLGVGLVTYSPSRSAGGIVKSLRFTVPLRRQKRRVLLRLDTQPFWAYFRDTSMQEIYFLLRQAKRLEDSPSQDVRGVAFDRLFLQMTRGKTRTLKGTVRKVSNTRKQRANYRKNYTALLNHVELWDETGRLAEAGERLLSIGRDNGPKSASFLDYFAGLLLVNGQHLRLIGIVRDFQSSIFNGRRHFVRDQFLRRLEAHVESLGYIRRNPGLRRGRKPKQPFRDELNIWNHLGLLRRRGARYFDTKAGLNFDDDRIVSLVAPLIGTESARL